MKAQRRRPSLDIVMASLHHAKFDLARFLSIVAQASVRESERGRERVSERGTEGPSERASKQGREGGREKACERARERDQKLEIRGIESVSCMSVSVPVSMTGTDRACVCVSGCTYTNPTLVSLHTQPHTNLHQLRQRAVKCSTFHTLPPRLCRSTLIPAPRTSRAKILKCRYTVA